MKTNYIMDTHVERTAEYKWRKSYAQSSPDISQNLKYYQLPEEYDVFSTIDPTLFSCNDTDQYKLISLCLQYMRKCLVSLYDSKSFVCILPKLTYFQDGDGTITLYWAYSNFRAFLSFEGKQSNYDSYYGIVIQDGEESISTQTKKININNYATIVNELMQMVIDNS